MKEITMEMVRKMKFVQQYVSPIVKRLDPHVQEVAYTYDHATGDEYVCVVCENNVQRVCVSADSMAQLTVDVVQGGFLS